MARRVILNGEIYTFDYLFEMTNFKKASLNFVNQDIKSIHKKYGFLFVVAGNTLSIYNGDNFINEISGIQKITNDKLYAITQDSKLIHYMVDAAYINHESYMDLYFFKCLKQIRKLKNCDNITIEKLKFTTGIVKVQCGYQHVVAIDDNRNAWSRGDNKYGQLGLGIFQNCRKFMQINIHDIVDVACGWNHTLLLDIYGHMWGCGDNRHDKYEDHVYYINNIPVLIQIDNVAKIYCCGEITSFALDVHGDLYMSGLQSGYYGTSKFTKISELSQIVDLAFSDMYDIFIIDCQGNIYFLNLKTCAKNYLVMVHQIKEFSGDKHIKSATS